MSTDLPRRLAAEVAGTALLVGIGTGSVVATSGGGTVRFAILAIAWFAAVTIPVFAFAGVSGSEINPAVSLALALDGRRPRRELPLYAAAQFAGAFLGSLAVGVASGSFVHLGATTPADGNVARTFLLEFAFTFALVLSVLALVRVGPGPHRWRLTWPGAVVAVSTFLIGPWTGSSLNPARTIAPAVLSGTYTDLWVYLVAVPLGAVVAWAAVWAVERSRAR